MKTKWGNAKINNKGYYHISSRGEGNHNKLLHRLIWEDFYGCEVPDGYVIHHKNGNKLDNCVLCNLQLMRKGKHRRLHMIGKNNYFYGKTHSDENKLKMSMVRNTSGYFRVSKRKNKSYKQGFCWTYNYYDEDGKHKTISSVDIEKLERKVKSKGLFWKKLEGE